MNATSPLPTQPPWTCGRRRSSVRATPHRLSTSLHFSVPILANPQVYKAVLRDTGEEVAIKVQRPGVEPTILRDLYIFRTCGGLFNALSRKRLGCDAQLIVDEFGEKLLEELDYTQVCGARGRGSGGGRGEGGGAAGRDGGLQRWHREM